MNSNTIIAINNVCALHGKTDFRIACILSPFLMITTASRRRVPTSVYAFSKREVNWLRDNDAFHAAKRECGALPRSESNHFVAYFHSPGAWPVSSSEYGRLHKYDAVAAELRAKDSTERNCQTHELLVVFPVEIK